MTFYPPCDEYSYQKSSQYWDHCIISFMGENWFIVRIKPGEMTGARLTEDGRCLIVKINTENIDWSIYCNEAVRWINAREQDKKRTPAK